jgi:Zn-dependent protease
MFKTSYKIASVAGIPIRAHITLVLTLPLLVLYIGWVPALIFATALLTSIVLHELGHSLVALRRGGRVEEILLLPIGGAARISRMSPRPVDELLMAAAGPAVSLLLFALLFFGGGLVPRRLGLWCVNVGTLHIAFFSISGVINVVQLIGVMNLALGLFNLLPAFPMDGGRMLRALLSRRLGRLKATKIAMIVGRFLAAILIGLGVYEWLAEDSFSMLIFIGMFVYWSAGLEYRAVRIQELWRTPMPWPFSGMDRDTPAGEDEAIVSPPPYRDGPNESTPIRPMRGPREY